MLPTVFITIHDDVGDLWGIFWRDLFASGRSKVRSRVGGRSQEGAQVGQDYEHDQDGARRHRAGRDHVTL